MAELKNIRIAVSGIYDYAKEEIPTLRIPLPGQGAPDWVEDKRIYKVYRPAAVLAAACGKFANLPLTHHHPDRPIDGQNFRASAVGWIGEHPEVDYIGETNEVGIRSTCVLYDDEALRAYGNGEIQLSPGYVAKFEWQQGKTPDGQEYDIIMREITDVNHVALLPAGRGGEYAVVMDGAGKEPSVFDIVRETTAKDGAPYGNDNASKDHVKKEEEADRTFDEMQKKAVAFPEVEFTRENYEKYLGKPLDTPLGKVKMGVNQFNKLKENKREHLIGAIAETLKEPNYIGRDTDGKIVYIKTFVRQDNPHNVVSLVIERDGLKISISSHDKRDKQVKAIITRAEPLQKSGPDHGTVRDNRVADSTNVDELIIIDNPEKVKSIFDLARGSVFDRARNK